MLKLDRLGWGIAVGTIVFVSVLKMPIASGELVYEDEQTEDVAGPALPQTPVQRPVLSTAPLTSVAPEPVQTSSVTAIPAPIQAAAPEVENMSRSELIRRERMRQELKNEDVLQERLEELRLRDEKHRADQIVSGAPLSAPAPTAPAPLVAAPLVNETVVPTVLERPGQAAQPAMTAPVLAAPAEGGTFEAHSEAQSGDVLDGGDSFLDKRPRFTIQPRGGVAGILGASGLDVVPRFSVGLGIGVELNDHLAFEAGYTFSEYGVGLVPTNGFVLGYMGWAGTYGTSPETQVLRQNIFDAGLKLHVLGRDSRIRPYLTGGGAYAKSFINWDESILRLAAPSVQSWLGQDYTVDAFLGFLGVGMDIRITKNISIGAQGRYYAVLTSRESSALNPAGFYGNSWGNAWNPLAYLNTVPDYDKERTGASLSNAGFFTVQAGLTFQF